MMLPHDPKAKNAARIAVMLEVYQKLSSTTENGAEATGPRSP